MREILGIHACFCVTLIRAMAEELVRTLLVIESTGDSTADIVEQIRKEEHEARIQEGVLKLKWHLCGALLFLVQVLLGPATGLYLSLDICMAHHQNDIQWYRRLYLKVF